MYRNHFGFCQCLAVIAIYASNGAAIVRMRDNGASALSEGGSDYRGVDYQPLLARAVANLPSTSMVAARHAIYERARKAQLAQLETVRPPLPEIDVAHEKEALDQAIALIEASFGGADSAPAGQPFAATIPAALIQQARTRAAPTKGVRTKVPIPPLSSLAEVVLPGARAETSRSLLWLALAAVLGAVLAIAGAAIVMRQEPRYLAAAPPEARQELASQQPANSAEPAQPSPNSTAPAPSARPASARPASAPPGSQPIAQSGAKPANHAPSSPTAPDAALAAVLIASDDPGNPVVSLGSTVWSALPPAPGKPATVAVKADVDIPDLKMHATMILRKNMDPTLQATHTIDLKFSFADGAPITGVKDVEPKMRNLGAAESEALTGVRAKISDAYFLIALAKGDQDAARNLDLMQTRAWLDFPLLLNDNRIAKLVIQKSANGEAMLAKALEAWK
jgi:cytoskeletal protein RodZ